MSHYIYRLFINFLLIHYFIYRLVRWSDPQYLTVPVSHRLFVEVFVSGNKSCLYGYDVPDTSIYQKDHWTGIPGSDPAILYLYVLDFF